MRYEVDVRVHIKPAIGDIKLQKLIALDLQELYRVKLEGASPKERAHSPQDPQAGRGLVTCPENAAEAVTAPRPLRKEVRILSAEEARRLLEAARGERFEALYVLAVTTGMR